uniref:Uncharacterized protein n=1 Tax=viral metagenome TaxID=1070528 RepID=A0A6M3JPU8_9ZZZZ
MTSKLLEVGGLMNQKFGEITKQNTTNKTTHAMIDISNSFFERENNPKREKMFRAAFKIFIAEIEHDIYYKDRFGWFIEEAIKAILNDNWEERTNGQPSSPHWNEDPPYGGKYSIVSKLKRHRAEILKIISS